MIYLVTGGCGFLGSNISFRLLEKGKNVFVFDNLSRYGSAQNLNLLNQFSTFKFINGDIRNKNDVERAIKKIQPDFIIHLAGQVAMTTSIENTILDFETNIVGSFNLLESVKNYSIHSKVIYSSTNKVYGDLEQYNYIENETRYICLDKPNGFCENTQLSFHSPYGVSKGSADQYFLDFNRIFGLKTVVFRHSSIYGSRQFSTENQGWVGWFISQAFRQKENSNSFFNIHGNGKQVRDLLYASDAAYLYIKTLENFDELNGNVFNIGGGTENSCSLIELFKILENKFKIEMKFKCLDPRESDQKVFISDITKIKSKLDWDPKVDKYQGIEKSIKWAQTINKK
jgi:CDP-paratose 2-epimerase